MLGASKSPLYARNPHFSLEGTHEIPATPPTISKAKLEGPLAELVEESFHPETRRRLIRSLKRREAEHKAELEALRSELLDEQANFAAAADAKLLRAEQIHERTLSQFGLYKQQQEEAAAAATKAAEKKAKEKEDAAKEEADRRVAEVLGQAETERCAWHSEKQELLLRLKKSDEAHSTLSIFIHDSLINVMTLFCAKLILI